METDLRSGFRELDSALDNADVADLTNDGLAGLLDGLFRLRAAVDGRIVVLLGEAERREAFRDDGATSAENWAVERFDVGVPAARALVGVAKKAWDIPQLTESLKVGEISFDKLRAVAAVATPETDGELVALAREHTVRELADVAAARQAAPAATQGGSGSGGRSLRMNGACRTMTVQLPPEDFAETRSCLETIAKEIPSDGETPWDQRMADGFMSVIRCHGQGGNEAGGRSPYFVVVHTPLAALIDEGGEPSELAGELERDGRLSVADVQRIACDATVALAVDDSAGRTMYEGRSRRDPTGAQRREVRRRDRHCRFPGCRNVTFADCHHIKEWKPDRGPTDLDNLCLLCVHHHGLVHRKTWTMTGNANEEITFVGPSGRVMTSRPSLLWTGVTAVAARRAAANRRTGSGST